MKKLICILLCGFILTGFKTNSGRLHLSVNTVFNGENIILGDKKYINQNGDTLTIETFRFYISNVVVHGSGKQYIVPGSYFLVDAEKKESKEILLEKLPFEKTDSISFCIGVDSMASVSGALDGALDPTLGMFWAWNTGYINAKLEGRSSSCKTLHNAYEFHIGGYLSPYKSLKRITIKTQSTSVTLLADAAKWFYGTKKIDLKEFNSVMFPCKNAMLVADNYSKMFSVN